LCGVLRWSVSEMRKRACDKPDPVSRSLRSRYGTTMGCSNARNRNSFHSCFYSAGVWFRLRRNNTCALLGFFILKNPSLCCEVTFGLRVTLQQSGLAWRSQAKPKRNFQKNERMRSCFESCANKSVRRKPNSDSRVVRSTSCHLAARSIASLRIPHVDAES
jgi:hypothetical protein